MTATPKFALLITTKNRVEDLFFTLSDCCHLLDEGCEIVVFDDGSSDGTTQMVNENFPKVLLHRNEISKGYLYCRNFMLNQTKAAYAVSLDDDANFLSVDPLAEIERHFIDNPNCGLTAFRIFWSKERPKIVSTHQKAQRVKGFVGCGHAWRMASWRQVPNYPEWFEFYGEEEFAAHQLFKENIEIHYLPAVLVHHRVNVSSRKGQPDYIRRQRRSLRSGWYIYLLFYPFKEIPRKFGYSVVMQIRNKTLKGDFKATYAMLLAFFDVFLRLPKLASQSNRLSNAEYKAFQQLAESRIYWKPDENEHTGI